MTFPDLPILPSPEVLSCHDAECDRGAGAVWRRPSTASSGSSSPGCMPCYGSSCSHLECHLGLSCHQCLSSPRLLPKASSAALLSRTSQQKVPQQQQQQRHQHQGCNLQLLAQMVARESCQVMPHRLCLPSSARMDDSLLATFSATLLKQQVLPHFTPCSAAMVGMIQHSSSS